MERSLSADHFFNLQYFPHASLFEGSDRVWVALTRLQSYLESFSIFRCSVELSPFVYLERPELIAIGEGAHIEPGAFLQGPCILGKGCVVRQGASLRGGVICGDGCVIGQGAEVKRSILLNEAKVAHLNYVGDSILGNDVNLGAGVKCANFRLDHREVGVFFEGQWIATGLQKLGCIVGDHSQIGCNSVISPGTFIGPRTLSYPLSHLRGTLPAGSKIKAKQGLSEWIGALETGEG